MTCSWSVKVPGLMAPSMAGFRKLGLRSSGHRSIEEDMQNRRSIHDIAYGIFVVSYCTQVKVSSIVHTKSSITLLHSVLDRRICWSCFPHLVAKCLIRVIVFNVDSLDCTLQSAFVERSTEKQMIRQLRGESVCQVHLHQVVPPVEPPDLDSNTSIELIS